MQHKYKLSNQRSVIRDNLRNLLQNEQILTNWMIHLDSTDLKKAMKEE